jgi:hypothetical protein
MSEKHSPISQIFTGVAISVISAYLVWKLGFQDHTKSESSSTANSTPDKEWQYKVATPQKQKTSLYIYNESRIYPSGTNRAQIILKVDGQTKTIDILDLHSEPDYEFESGGTLNYEIQFIGIYDGKYYDNNYYGSLYLVEGTKNEYTLNSVQQEFKETKLVSLVEGGSPMPFESTQYTVHKLFLSKK